MKTLEYKDVSGKGLPAVIRIEALVILKNCNYKFNLPEFDVRDHS